MIRKVARSGVGLLPLAFLGLACARQGAPPGGTDDRRPPVVVEVEPDTFATVEAGMDRLRIRFNERISEQAATGPLDGVVEISPEIPGLRVEHDRHGLDIQIPGGLAPGLTYRVRILPAVRDMFGNPMAVPFEWIFSTGGPFTENAVVGQVWDRATGEFLEDVRVVLTPTTGPMPDTVPGPDTLRYVATSGADGLFALRVLPPESFRVTAFQDRNRNLASDWTEPVGEARVPELAPTDTAFLSIPLLLPDSTPAVLAQSQVLDSVSVRLVFDDNLDPTLSLDGVTVSLVRDTAAADSLEAARAEGDPEAAAGDSVGIPGVLRLFHAAEWVVYRDSVQAVADSLAALQAADSLAAAPDAADAAVEAGRDTVPSDTALAAPPARTLPAAGGAPGARPGQTGPGGPDPREVLPDGTPMPLPSLVILLDGPLPAGVPVRITVDGVTNLNGLPGGGGSVGAVWAPPPPPDTTVTDTAGVPDTLTAPPDTLRPGTLLLVPGR